MWLLLTTFALGTEKPSLLLAAVVGLNVTGLAFTSHGQLAFSMTGFVLATCAAVSCGVKLALLQTVLGSTTCSAAAYACPLSLFTDCCQHCSGSLPCPLYPDK